MLSKSRNLFEKLIEPDPESEHDKLSPDRDNMLLSKKAKSGTKEETPTVELLKSEEKETDDKEGWELVNGKRIKMKKEKEYKSYILSELIKNDVCIHCMSGNCREGSKSHSSVYYPDGFTAYIKNPLIIEDLDDILKKNPIQDEKFQKYAIHYSICMRNHCRNRCKLNHGVLHFKDESGIEGEIHYCYPDLNILHRKKIVLGLHIDVQYMETHSKQPEISWKSKHNVLSEDDNLSPDMDIMFLSESSKELTKKTEDNDENKKNVEDEKSKSPKVLTTWAKLASLNVEENKLKIEIPSPSLDKKPHVDSVETNSIFSLRRHNSPPFKGNPIFTELLTLVKSQQERLEEESKKVDTLIEMNMKLIRMNESYYDQMSVLRYDMKLMKDSMLKMDEIHKMVSKSVDSREKYKLFSEFLKDSNNSITEQIVTTNYDRYIVFN